MMVILPDDLQARIHARLQDVYPNEGGGFLLGRFEGNSTRVVDVEVTD